MTASVRRAAPYGKRRTSTSASTPATSAPGRKRYPSPTRAMSAVGTRMSTVSPPNGTDPRRNATRAKPASSAAWIRMLAAPSASRLSAAAWSADLALAGVEDRAPVGRPRRPEPAVADAGAPGEVPLGLSRRRASRTPRDRRHGRSRTRSTTRPATRPAGSCCRRHRSAAGHRSRRPPSRRRPGRRPRRRTRTRCATHPATRPDPPPPSWVSRTTSVPSASAA